MARILISTLYHSYSTLTICNKYAIEHVYSLIDEAPDKTMQDSIRILKESLGSIIKFETKVTDLYNIVSVAREVVALIDEIPNKDEIFIDITSGRKPKSLGLLYASYARANRIKQITYVPEETKQPMIMPKMAYPISEPQLELLQLVKVDPTISTTQLAERLKYSRAMIYRYMKELMDINVLYKEDDQLKITDFGEIVLL